MNKFVFEDYKDLLLQIIAGSEKKGRGLSAKLAQHLSVHNTYMTHVLRGESHLSVEQAIKVCDFFVFSELETDFFLQLVQQNRAGDQKTKMFFDKKLEALRREGLKLKVQLRKNSTLSPEEQAIFYSDWTYSAVRLSTALPEGRTIDEIAKLLGLPERKVKRIIDFLLKTGLCKQEPARLTYGTFSTYVGSDSPFAKKLHDNWRLRTISYGPSNEEDLLFTSAVTLTKNDFLKLRETLLTAIKTVEKVTDDSEPKILAYINLDWIRVT